MNYVEVHTIKSILSPKVAGSTPTLYALKEVCKSIRNFRKSVVVLVTDGVPNRDQIDELPSFLKFIRDKGLKVLIFFIDPPKDVKLEKIFGDKSFWRKTTSKTLERDLISFVVNEVLKNLRG
ncbi:MAG TPA: VWA domain-containing protein [Archaeoglobus sp.]|nr:VWA domain-containing protein [Archaeoglobus sp.]